MRLLRHVFERARTTLVVASLANLLNAAASAALLKWIHSMLSPNVTSSSLAPITFSLVLVVIFASGLCAQLALIRMAARAAYDVRIWLAHRILALPLAHLERLGSERIYACLTQDVLTLSNAWTGLPIVAFHVAVLAGGCLYLIWLSWSLFALLVATLMLGLVSYQRLAKRGRTRMGAMREAQDVLHKHFDALVHGAKELRSSARRAHQLMRLDLEPDARQLRELHTSAFTSWAIGNNWGNVLTLAAVGVVFAYTKWIGGDHASELLGFVIAVLFLRAHIGAALGALPALAQGDVALRKIDALGLGTPEVESSDLNPIAPRAPCSDDPAPAWRTLSLAGVSYGYGADGEGFELGPVDLSLNRGELIFVTGGNGSGKSTFVRVLAGLYAPKHGEIRLDGVPVDTGTEAYRSRFNVLFADYHAFARLTTRTDADVEREASGHFEALGLARKLDPRAEHQPTHALSSGERRRLALVSAYLEGGEIYVFDEWAADQDPHYRAAFYHEMLPALRARGVTVIVVTHDDRYFDCADRLLQFEEGRARWQTASESTPRRPLRASAQ